MSDERRPACGRLWRTTAGEEEGSEFHVQSEKVLALFLGEGRQVLRCVGVFSCKMNVNSGFAAARDKNGTRMGRIEGILNNPATG